MNKITHKFLSHKSFIRPKQQKKPLAKPFYSNYKAYTYREDVINNWLAQSKKGYLKDFRKWIRENKRKIKDESIKDNNNNNNNNNNK